MRKYLFSVVWIWLLFCVCTVSAQRQSHSPYYFDEFKQALLIGKGVQYTVKVNYDLVSGHWFFIDSADRNLVKELYPEEISLIKIEGKTYLMSEGALVEMIQAEPYLCVEYDAVTRNAPKSTSYGGETQTAAVDNYSELIGGSLNGGQQLKNKIVTGIEKIYMVKVGKKTRRFSDAKEFVKLFEKEKRAEVEAYLVQNPTDFTSIESVVKLVGHYFKE